MLGAIIGDITGSTYEFMPVYTSYAPLFGAGANFTDDTVCTLAVASGLAHNTEPVDEMKKWCREYPMRGYGPGFNAWVNGSSRVGYDSWGNGAVMRISPVGLFAKSLEEAESMSLTWTQISHNHEMGLRSARTLSRILFRLIAGENKEAILDEMTKASMPFESVEAYIKIGGYHIEADKTLMRAAACVMESSTFEEVMRKVVHIGSDTDTTAAAAGPMAEVLFGIPTAILDEALDAMGAQHNHLMKFMASLYENSVLGKTPASEYVMNKISINYCLPRGNEIFGQSKEEGLKISFTSNSILHLAKANPNVAVLSIADQASWRAFGGGWAVLLQMNFFDVDDSVMSAREKFIANLPLPEYAVDFLSRFRGSDWPWRPMYACDAKRIAAFFEQAKALNVKEIVIACEYGKSRSAAVAKVLMESIGQTDGMPDTYNTRVYHLLKQVVN